MIYSLDYRLTGCVVSQYNELLGKVKKAAQCTHLSPKPETDVCVHMLVSKHTVFIMFN